MIEFNFTPIDMSPVYKQELDLGWITKDTVKSYVTVGIITADQYEKITGDKYEADQG